jgi:hypothetical protein
MDSHFDSRTGLSLCLEYLLPSLDLGLGSLEGIPLAKA